MSKMIPMKVQPVYVKTVDIEKSLEMHIELCMAAARKAARDGLNTFTFDTSRINSSYKFKFNDRVNKVSGGTVYTGRGSLLPGAIKFYIKEESDE
jgi:hypothetical protein